MKEATLLKCEGECLMCSEHAACHETQTPTYTEVVIRDIKEESVALHYKNEFMGYIHTELSLYDVRCQIADKALDGYSIKFKNEEFPITSKGNFLAGDTARTFFPLMEQYLNRLLRLM